MHIDLHTHTTASDGKLTPTELVQHAVHSGIDTLAITDHDTVEAYGLVGDTGPLPLRLIPGIEFSTQWQKIDVHILGLNIDIRAEALKTGVAFQQQHRMDRARHIADKLSRLLGINDLFDAVQQLARHNNIGRPHFAEYLIRTNVVKDQKEAFRKYLGIGKKAYVKPSWAGPADIIQWIRDAGGTAVLAHPAKYDLSQSKLLKLIDDFIAAHGQGLEVIAGKQTAALTGLLARICGQKGLLASCGSDFHGPDQHWGGLGNFPALPGNCIPVWDSW